MTRILLLALILMLFHSCTIEKRLYQKGFHVEWKKRNTSEDVLAGKRDSTERTADGVEQVELSGTIKAPPQKIHGATGQKSTVESVAVLSDEVLAAAVSQPVVSEDTLIGSEKPETAREKAGPEAIRRYNTVTLILGLTMLALFALCLLLALTTLDLNALLIYLLLALLILVFTLILMAVRNNFRPDRVAKRKLKKEEQQLKQE